MAYGLLLLRVVAGLTIAAHGTQKLFGWFGGGGLKGTADSFGGLGFRPATLMALLAGVAETSGVVFAVGFLTPLAALGMATVMLNAIESVHWKNGFFAGKGGYEFNLQLLAIAVGVTAAGPGRFSLDRALGWNDNLSGLWWGVGVLVAAAVISVVTTGLLRQRTPAV
jgi:putative oxidoreductase